MLSIFKSTINHQNNFLKDHINYSHYTEETTLSTIQHPAYHHKAKSSAYIYTKYEMPKLSRWVNMLLYR